MALWKGSSQGSEGPKLFDNLFLWSLRCSAGWGSKQESMQEWNSDLPRSKLLYVKECIAALQSVQFWQISQNPFSICWQLRKSADVGHNSAYLKLIFVCWVMLKHTVLAQRSRREYFNCLPAAQHILNYVESRSKRKEKRKTAIRS